MRRILIYIFVIILVVSCHHRTSTPNLSCATDSISLFNVEIPDIDQIEILLDNLAQKIDSGDIISRNPYYMVQITSLPDSDESELNNDFNVQIRWVQFSFFENKKYYGFLTATGKRIFLLEKCDRPVLLNRKSLLVCKTVPITSEDGHNLSIIWNYNYTNRHFKQNVHPEIVRFNDTDTVYESKSLCEVADSLSNVMKKTVIDFIGDSSFLP